MHPAVTEIRNRMQESILQAAAQDPNPDHTEHEGGVDIGVHYQIEAHLEDDHGIDLSEVRGGTMSLTEIHDRVHGLFTEVPEDAPAAVFPSLQYRAVVRDIDRRHGPSLQVEQKINGEWHGTPGNYYATSVADLLTSGQRLSIDHGQGWGLSREDSKALGAFATLLLALYGEGEA